LAAREHGQDLPEDHLHFPRQGRTYMDVLFFCPTCEKTNVERLSGILRAIPLGAEQPKVDVFDENSATGGVESKKYDAVVIVFTAEVELSERLYEIVRYVEREKPLGRFIFLPKSGGKEIIPPIFHPIRALQLQLFYYSPGEPLDSQLGEFEQDWSQFVQPVRVEQPGKKGARGRTRQAGFGLILLASIFALVAVGLITIIAPIIPDMVLRLTPTPIHPPAATAFWLQETFRAEDTTTRWQEQHYYTGKQALQTEFLDSGLRLSAEPVVTDAVYQLDSLQSWPLDKLQSLSFSFVLSAMDDLSAKNALEVGLVLSEDSSYYMDCVIIPAKTEGKIQCQIQSPEHPEALSEAIPFSLGSRHTASLVFDPLTYSVQFFLDDQYHGRSEIQSVQFWRARNFNLMVRDELQNMNNGSYSCELENLDLAHQP
jgi:hypothetical protein